MGLPTKGAYYAFPSSLLKIVPMSQDWLDHLNSLADTKPSDAATYLEFWPRT